MTGLNFLRGFNGGPETGDFSVAEAAPVIDLQLLTAWNAFQNTKAGRDADYGRAPAPGFPEAIPLFDTLMEGGGNIAPAAAHAAEQAVLNLTEKPEMRPPTSVESEQQRLEADSLAEIYHIHADEERMRAEEREQQMRRAA
jgi:hypothetical protein